MNNAERSTIQTNKWAIHRHLYDWVLSFAHSPHATLALFLISIIESSVFPIAPDILQIALSLENNSKAWLYASISSVGSVIGGIIGYALGALAWHLASDFFFSYVFTQEQFNHVSTLYTEWGFWAVIIAAFTPVPYKVFTLSAGAFHFPIIPFIFASFVGRAARFFLVAFLIKFYGPSIKTFIDKYFNLITIVLLLMLVGGFLILQSL